MKTVIFFLALLWSVLSINDYISYIMKAAIHNFKIFSLRNPFYKAIIAIVLWTAFYYLNSL